MDLSDPAFFAASAVRRETTAPSGYAPPAKFPTRISAQRKEISGYFLTGEPLVRYHHYMGKNSFYCSSCTNDSHQGDLCPVVQRAKEALRAKGTPEKELYMAEGQRVFILPFFVERLEAYDNKSRAWKTYKNFFTGLEFTNGRMRTQVRPKQVEMSAWCLSCGNKSIQHTKWVAPDGNEVTWSDEDRAKNRLPVNRQGDGLVCTPREVYSCRKCSNPVRASVYDTRVTIKWVAERTPLEYDFEMPFEPPSDFVRDVPRVPLEQLAKLVDPNTVVGGEDAAPEAAGAPARISTDDIPF